MFGNGRAQSSTQQDEQNSSIHNDDEEEYLKKFEAVMSRIQFDALPSFATSIRIKLGFESSKLQASDSKNERISPGSYPVLSLPLFGSYHILYPLEFADGDRWILKVPATGTRENFDEINARALVSEAMTMRLLKNETTIPIPEIYAFDSSVENDLQCPYILMEYIRGIPLSDCWFDNVSSPALVEQHRVQALRDVASAMVQMGNFAYDYGGSPLFDIKNTTLEIGAMRTVNVQAMMDRLQTEDADNELAIYCESGPFSDPKAFFLNMLDRRELPSDELSEGVHKLLHLFIEWVPYGEIYPDPKFVLTHPDFDIQNVLVSKDGNLCGLIDWDGVAAVPRCIGNERYPGWLTRDWDPVKYCYAPDASLHENSPEELAHYRDIYRQAIGKCLCQQEFNSSHVNSTNPDGSSSANDVTRITRCSLVAESLEIAASDPMCTFEIIQKIFEEIKHLVLPGPSSESSDANREEDVSKEETTRGNQLDNDDGQNKHHESITTTKDDNVGEGEDTQDDSAGEDDDSKEDSAGEDGDTDEEDYDDDDDDDDDFYLYEVAIAYNKGELDQKRLNLLKSGFALLFS